MVLTHVDLIEKLLHYNRKFLCVFVVVLSFPVSRFLLYHCCVLLYLNPLVFFYRPSHDSVAAMERSKDKAAY